MLQRDLGVLVCESQEVRMQVQHIIKKADGMLSFIKKEIELKSKADYTSVIQGISETIFWSPYLRTKLNVFDRLLN